MCPARQAIPDGASNSSNDPAEHPGEPMSSREGTVYGPTGELRAATLCRARKSPEPVVHASCRPDRNTSRRNEDLPNNPRGSVCWAQASVAYAAGPSRSPAPRHSDRPRRGRDQQLVKRNDPVVDDAGRAPWVEYDADAKPGHVRFPVSARPGPGGAARAWSGLHGPPSPGDSHIPKVVDALSAVSLAVLRQRPPVSLRSRAGKMTAYL